ALPRSLHWRSASLPHAGRTCAGARQRSTAAFPQRRDRGGPYGSRGTRSRRCRACGTIARYQVARTRCLCPLLRIEARSMPKKSYRQAINEALRQEMRRDPNIIVLGEDVAGGQGGSGEVGGVGGVFGVTGGLYKEFGPTRVLDTPISESAIVGAA